MDVQKRNESTVRISYDEMEAYLTLSVIVPEGGFHLSDILNLLEQSGVKAGIDQQAIKRMIQERIYGREVLVAVGTPEQNGENAYYEYNFDTELNHKPQVRPDGSVDYWSLHMVELVEQGQVIAIYHEPTKGHNGITVKGRILPAKDGRPLPPLVGVGFEKSEDNKIYTSVLDGKIEMKNERIMISAVHEVFGDADMNTGNIDFRGDVIIHGNVAAGMKICASGSITIDGFAEACTLQSGKDLVIRGGMIGAQKGEIRCRGNLFIKFAEYAQIECDGAIQTCAFLNSRVSCGDRVYANGSKGMIIGGMVYGVRGIDANVAGNEKEVDTELVSGAGIATVTRIKEIEAKIEQIEQEITKVETAIHLIEERAKEQNTDVKNDSTRVSLLRTKIVKQADLGSAQDELSKLMCVAENAKDALIRIYKDVYPGVTVYINDQKKKITEQQKQVQFEVSSGKLRMYQIEDD